MSRVSKIRQACYIISGGGVMFALYGLYSGDRKFYKELVMPAASKVLDGEQAHRVTVKLAQFNLLPKCSDIDDNTSTLLKSKVWGREFQSPIGLAAGFDKQGECMSGMLRAGFDFVEIGSITPEPQPGNSKPRVFRLREDKAVINRYGFNSDGHDVVYDRVAKWRETHKKEIVGVNLGKNKDTPVEETVEDYCKGVRKFSALADYIVINISSPNTSGLQQWQSKERLKVLIEKVANTRDSIELPGSVRRPMLVVKISCDVDEVTKGDIASVLMSSKVRVDGIIVANTSSKRPESLLCGEVAAEVGGLSGEPIRALSTELIGDMYKLTRGSIPIIGCGGVSSGQDAYDKIRAGASLIQLYTALVYEGPLVACRIRQELAECLHRDGFTSVTQAVGAQHTQS